MVNKSMSVVQEFINFIKGFSVIGLAIAVVIGTAVTKLVASLVDNIITPIVGILLNGSDFSGLVIQVGKSKIMYGMFIGSLIDFLIIVAVVWAAVKLIVGKMLTPEEKAKLGM
ncbi:MAG: MscL family protein [candidate division SR1 bacterium]|nr:MscL family protein [candidate division SR1 bacterium]